MHTDSFYRMGKIVYVGRWLVIVFSLLLVLACIPFLSHIMEPFKQIGFTDPNSESARSNAILNEKLGFSYNRFIIMYDSNKLTASQPKFLQDIKNSLSDLKLLSPKPQIIYPTFSNQQISTDKHTAYAVISFPGKQEVDEALVKQLKSTIKKPLYLNMHIGGEPIFLEDIKKQTQIDMYKAEYIGTPVAIITMLIVFESVVAASLPVILGGLCALFILMTLYYLGHIFTLSVFTLNIALLLGLCLSLDYSLLIINRYRDELHKGHSVMDAIAITLMTAGKAVFFSGLAVFISLSALLLFPINVLFSVGMGGLAAVLVAVIIAILLLPSILAVLGLNINLFPIRLLKHDVINSRRYWHWLISKVVKRSTLFFCLALFVLLSLGYPFLKAQFGISNFKILSDKLESRRVFNTFETKFGESRLAPLLVIIKTKDKNILTAKNIGNLYDFSKEIKQDARVDSIVSIVNTAPRLTKIEYQTLYAHPAHLNSALKEFVKHSTNGDLTLMTVFTKYPSNSAETTALIKKIRLMKPNANLTIQVSGTSVNTVDALKVISHTFPYAFLWIITFTYLVLLVLLRSIVLPIKAIITTILSLCASYGILVLVIQQGYLYQFLQFEPQGMLDISLLIIIFCALFGISMDYEVFLLTRIKEYYEQTQQNNQSIILGIERSAKIISSAAIIVIVLCCSFMSAEILIVKAFGLGIAVAVFVDAFIIRTILVPATMSLLGKWNWYSPRWINKIIPKISFDPEQ
jgi:RND superfamily putative drug exporter